MLRGVAILGTLGTNIWIFTDPRGPAGVFAGLAGAGVEQWLRFLANGKFLALLTLLFGVGWSCSTAQRVDGARGGRAGTCGGRRCCSSRDCCTTCWSSSSTC